jgi:hypothetical protein
MSFKEIPFTRYSPVIHALAIFCLVIIGNFVLLSCTSTPVTPESSFSSEGSNSSSGALQTDTPYPTRTPLPSVTPLSSDTPTPEPSATPSSTHTQAPTDTATPGLAAIPENAIMLYFILPGTGGTIACGDSIVPAYSGLTKSGDIKKDITTALNRLFSIRTKKVGILSNPLFQSNLKVSSVDYNKSSERITVYLNGGFVKPKDECDQLRYRAQVWSTIRQFGVRNVIVWVNDKLLGDLLAANDN